VSLTYPKAGPNDSLSRILIGLHDDYSGLDLKSFEVKTDFDMDGMKSGENIAARFKQVNPGVWELRLETPITELPRGELTVAVRDQQGNRTYLKRTFSVVKPEQ
jgi:hypothetical protein